MHGEIIGILCIPVNLHSQNKTHLCHQTVKRLSFTCTCLCAHLRRDFKLSDGQWLGGLKAAKQCDCCTVCEN